MKFHADLLYTFILNYVIYLIKDDKYYDHGVSLSRLMSIFSTDPYVPLIFFVVPILGFGELSA